MARNYCECYKHGRNHTRHPAGHGNQGSGRRQTIAAGYRAFRMDAASHARHHHTYKQPASASIRFYEDCVQTREGVGKGMAIGSSDFHQRFGSLGRHARLRSHSKSRRPYFVEGPGAPTEAFQQDLPILRRTVKVADPPPARSGAIAGTSTRLVENHDIELPAAPPFPNGRRHHRDGQDRRHLRNSLRRNCPALHRAPSRRLPLVNTPGAHFPGPVMMEYNFPGPHASPHLPRMPGFQGRQTLPQRPTRIGEWKLDTKQLKLIAEIHRAGSQTRTVYFRPDGSITNW